MFLVEPLLTAAPGLTAMELTPSDEPLLQRFFVENPLYFLAVHGRPAEPLEAHEEINEPLPEGWPYTKRWIVGYVAADGRLAAMANVVSDLLAPQVWHVGTFIVATERHGRGDAQVLLQGLEAWAQAQGAQWLRLGVVSGHLRAERFWERQGFQQIRLRTGVVMGQRTNTLRVMCKPLAGGTLQDYLARVVRDRPEPEAEAAGRPG